MTKAKAFQAKPIAIAVTSALLTVAAQQAIAQQATQDTSELKLEEVVVTASATARSKMTQSNSVSTLDLDQILKAAPTSGAEILRNIPGVRSESSGGEGNANVTVRGVPISAGGARYVQFQEDGLPVLQFGDIAFGTPDSFFRLDNTLDRLEVVRGGAASTMATNSPGGIINFISKNGDTPGGSIGITKGIDFDQTRYDFDYGGKLNDKLRYFIGGYYRSGEGVRPSGNLPLEEGGQIKGNITQELDNGFIRFNFKMLDDKAPTNLPVPVVTNNGSISAAAGIDPRTASFYSPYWTRDVVLNKDNTRSPIDVNSGLSVKSNSVGLETQLKLANGWKLDEKFKSSQNSGRFVGIFPSSTTYDASAGTTYATGPKAGQAYSGKVFDAVVFNTSIDNLNLTANDARISRDFNVGDGMKLNTAVGLYSSIQNVALTWNFNRYLTEATNASPSLLSGNTSDGKTADSTGLVTDTSGTFGGCCGRSIDAKYVTQSPYVALGFETGPWNIDGSVRQDNQKATGTYNQVTAGTPNGGVYAANTVKSINYSVDHTSYSLGTNYRVNKDLAYFARVSEGVAFNADRIMYGQKLDGSLAIPTNIVKQLEGGVKYKNGGFSTFITLFNAKTDESNYEATTQTFSANKYEANGVEFESAYRAGNFRVAGGLTLTDAEIKASNNADTVGKTPRRQAKYVYQVAPSYLMGDFNVGAAIQGTGDSWGDDANTIKLKGFIVVNPYASYRIDDRTTASVVVNNAFNKLGFTEVEGDGHAARSINGRSVRATLNYKF